MKKRGKRIKTIAVLPNGFRRDERWELPIRAALLSMDTLGHLNEGHLYDLWVLAEMSRRTGAKGHYLTHANSLERLIDNVHSNKGEVSDSDAAGIQASAGVLLEYIRGVSNLDIARAAMSGVKLQTVI